MINSKIYKAFIIPVIVGIALVTLLAGCSRGGGTRLKRHDLFSLPLGTLPNEIDWFYRDSFRMAGTADIHTQNGLIFIAGGETGKVMVFNSYGDLITFVYNPAKNPRPVTSENGAEERNISPWPFRNPRTIAAYDGGFLVEDGIEAERRVEDPLTGVFYDRVVLRFDMDGLYLGYLGKEGYGGTPFPYISSLDVREDGAVVVNSRITGGWMSYWFDKAGSPIATVKIQEDQLPGLQEGGNAAVYSVHPDPVDWTLHIRLDIYSDSRHGDMPEPRLYTLDLSTLTYNDPIILKYLEGDPKAGIPSIPPDYLGTTRDGLHLMLAPEGPSQYRMMFIDGEGRFIQNRRLKLKESATVYRRFRLQNNGMLTGIFFDNKEASIAWWRSDKLVENDR